jgi:hypothetical protein
MTVYLNPPPPPKPKVPVALVRGVTPPHWKGRVRLYQVLETTSQLQAGDYFVASATTAPREVYLFRSDAKGISLRDDSDRDSFLGGALDTTDIDAVLTDEGYEVVAYTETQSTCAGWGR